MLVQEESIYNLVPKEEPPKPKPKRYKSKYSPAIPPTYSTFCLKTTSIPGVANASGEYELPCGSHKPIAKNATFGLPKGGAKADIANFTKKGTGTMKLPERIQAFSNPDKTTKCKPPIPTKEEKPIMGLTSEKNYIVANAVENILAGTCSLLKRVAPKNVKPAEKLYTQKAGYGKVPRYLKKIENEVGEEYKLVKEMQQQEEEAKEREKFLLSDQEKQQLIAALKKKWEVLNHEYEEIITRVTKTNPLGLKTLKENLEKEVGWAQETARGG